MNNKAKIAVLFPGQGSQYLGMAKEFMAEDPEASLLMDLAESICGFPLRRLCQDGPLEELTRTVHLQPAMTVVNLICWQACNKAGLTADYMAGHSLGEYSALCAAGILNINDTLALVTERGRLMERESDKHPGGMRAVLGLTLAEVRGGLASLSESDGIVTAANHNSDKQIVISGEMAALDKATFLMSQQGGKVIPLKVSGAWHSQLVKDAVPDFTAAMEKISFNSPDVPVIFNVTAAEEKEPAVIRAVMASQIASMVKWFDIINLLLAREVRTFIEVGPKTVLTGLLKKIVPAGYEYRAGQIDTPASLANCLKVFGDR